MGIIFNLCKHNRKVKLIITIIIILLFIWRFLPIIQNNDFNTILEANILNVYNKDGNLVTVIDNPIELFESTLVNGQIVVSRSHTLQSIPRRDMVALYNLEFVKGGKVISKIDVLTSKTESAAKKLNESSIRVWFEADNQYVVLYKNRQYFSFGIVFFENLSKRIEGS